MQSTSQVDCASQGTGTGMNRSLLKDDHNKLRTFAHGKPLKLLASVTVPTAHQLPAWDNQSLSETGSFPHELCSLIYHNTAQTAAYTMAGHAAGVIAPGVPTLNRAMHVPTMFRPSLNSGCTLNPEPRLLYVNCAPQGHRCYESK